MKTKSYALIAFFFAYFSLFAQVSDDNLIAHYSFDGNAGDASANGLDGEVVGAELTTDRYGNANSAYYFDGVDDYIDLGNSSLLKPSLPMSISCWIREGSSSSGDVLPVFGNNFDDTRYYGIRVTLTSGQQITIQYGDGGTTGPDSRKTAWTTPPTKGHWFHYVGIIEEDSTLHIYINGEEADIELTGNGGKLTYSDGNSLIGKADYHENEEPDYFNGSLDDLRFYNRVLSEDEIYELSDPDYQESFLADYDLTAYYPLDGEANDLSVNELNGEIIGAQPTTDRYGSPNSAYYFDGVDDYIDLGNSSLLKPEPPFSIAFWGYYYDYNSSDPFFVSDFTEDTYYGVRVHVTKDNHLTLQLGNGGISGSSSRMNIDASEEDTPLPKQWFHVTAIVDSTLNMTLYVNGKKISTTESGTANSLLYSDADATFGVHDPKQNGEPYFLHGKLDEVYLFNKILSEDEIEQLAEFDSTEVTENYTITIDSVPIIETSNVTVPVYLEVPDETKFCAFGIYITGFNEDADFISVQNDEGTLTYSNWMIATNVVNDTLIISGASGYDCDTSGVLFNLNFTVNDSEKARIIPLTITEAIFDTGGVSVDNDNGAIIVMNPSTLIPGDVDYNDVIQRYDAALILKYLVGKIDLTQPQQAAANVSGDSTISAYDASLILNYKTRIIPYLPYTGYDSLASQNLEVSMSDIDKSTDGKIVVPLNLTSSVKIAGFECEFSYNTDLLQLDSVETTDALSGFASDYYTKDGIVKFASSGQTTSLSNTKLLNLIFSAKTSDAITDTISLETIRLNEDAVIKNAAITHIDGVTGVTSSEDLDYSYSLAQNYPNPFNPTTKITYTIPESGLVTLKVYNVLGQLVTTLVNETKTSGEYTVDFNASSLASGIYFYRITSGSFIATKKMMLIK